MAYDIARCGVGRGLYNFCDDNLGPGSGYHIVISDTSNTRPVEGMFIHLNRPVRNANMSQSSPAMGLTSAAPVNLKLCFYIKFPDKCNLFRNLQT